MKIRYVYHQEANGGDGGVAAGGAPAVPSPPAATPAPAANPPANFRDSLPQELRDDPALADFHDPAALAKAYRDTKAMVGGMVRIPSEEAGEEAIKAFAQKILENRNLGLIPKPDPNDPESMEAYYRAMGRPEDASGYQAPEGVDAEMFGAMTEKALELGISKQAFEQLSAHQAAIAREQLSKRQAAVKQGIDQLRGELGPAYDQRVARAGMLVKQMGGHEALEAAIANGTVDASTLRMLDKMATQMGAEGAPLAGQLGGANMPTVADLEAKRAEVTDRLIKENLSNQQREALQNRMIELSQQIVDARA